MMIPKFSIQPLIKYFAVVSTIAGRTMSSVSRLKSRHGAVSTMIKTTVEVSPAERLAEIQGNQPKAYGCPESSSGHLLVFGIFMNFLLFW